MGRKAAKVNQIDIERTIRAMKNSGIENICAIVKEDGVYIQTQELNPHNTQVKPIALPIEIRL